MNTETAERTSTADIAGQRNDVAVIAPPRLPYHEGFKTRFDVDKSAWRVLVEAIFPSAKSVEAILMALSYCQTRKLDIFKRPVHIVPMWSTAANGYVETVWPGIAELRTTAFRTGQYAGCDEAAFGPTLERTFSGRVKEKGAWLDKAVTVKFPEWCRLTVYRDLNGKVCKFVGPKVAWLETYATQGNSDIPNEMWHSRTEGQLEKCAEAAALRRAFPEELGNMLSAEEMEGRKIIDGGAVVPKDDAPAPPPVETTQGASQEPTQEPAQTATKEAEAAGETVTEAEIVSDGPPDPGDEVTTVAQVAKPKAAAKPRTTKAKLASDVIPPMPPARSEPEAFIKWVNLVLGKVTDPDRLLETWETKIDIPLGLPDLIATDQEECDLIYRQHETRLAP